MPHHSTDTPKPSTLRADPLNDADLRERFAQYLVWTDSNADMIGVKRIYIDIAGDLVAGVILSQVLFWSSPTRETGRYKMADKEYWVAKSRKDWHKECRVSPKQVDRAFTVLKKKGLVETEKAGFAGKAILHFRLDYCNFLQAWEQQRQLLGIEYEKEYRRDKDDIRPRVLPKRRNAF